MRLVSSLPASLLLIAAVVGPAAADTAVEPAFAIMDNTGDPSHVAADVALSVKDFGDGMIARANLRGQIVTPGGIGGYAGVAATSFLFAEDDDEGSTELGDLELGGLYQTRTSPTSTLGVRAGLILPTATYDDEGDNALPHLLGTITARPVDVATISTETTWLRVGVSPTYHDNGLFLRADVGLDIPVLETEGVDSFGHVNLGIGFGQQSVSGTLELQNGFSLGEDLDLEERFFHTGAVSVRYHAGSVAPFVAVSSPLDDAFRGDIVMLTVGLSAPL